MLTPEEMKYLEACRLTPLTKMLIAGLVESEARLLKACENYIQWYDNSETDAHSHELYMDPLREAIAQAKGTS